MSQFVCLGFFHLPVILISEINHVHTPSYAVLHRGRRNIHVRCSHLESVGNLEEETSFWIGPLLGDIGSVSKPLTKEVIEGESYSNTIFMRAFFNYSQTVHVSGRVSAFVFTHFSSTQRVQSIFHWAKISLFEISNYQSSFFFNTPQIPSSNQEHDSPHGNPAVNQDGRINGCRVQLMIHQVKGVEFLMRCESNSPSIGETIWHHAKNNWVRIVYGEAIKNGTIGAHINFKTKGGILADDMGLGKTLVTLSLIRLTQQSAIEFSQPSNSSSSSNLRVSSTLVIAPLTTIESWIKEIKQHFNPGSLPFLLFHSNKKSSIGLSDVKKSAIVLVTYETLIMNTNQLNTDKKNRCLDLCELEWFRIVLDEAHYVKDPKTTRNNVLNSLNADRRICLTGTPLQNNLVDLHSLIRFIKLEPWSNELLWKSCIEGRVQAGDPKAIDSLHNIMIHISLRRLKKTILNMPEKQEIMISIPLIAPWDEKYAAQHQNFAKKFGRNRPEGQSWDHNNFFSELMDLRQMCNHPALVEKNVGTKQFSWMDSSKIVHLLNDLQSFLNQELDGDPPKAVIFSEFSRLLSIIEVALDERRISWVKLIGSLEMQTRCENLDCFRKNKKCQVLLATIRSGGVGIDLRCAQKVYIMEPTWNPSLEEQAVDRLYRLGQKNTVQVVRYCISESIEVNINQIKRKKAELSMLSIPLSGNEEFELAKILMC